MALTLDDIHSLELLSSCLPLLTSKFTTLSFSLPKLLAKDVVTAAGLHKDVKDTYFRIGHMGATACDDSRGDIDRVLGALKEALEEAGWDCENKKMKA